MLRKSSRSALLTKYVHNNQCIYITCGLSVLRIYSENFSSIQPISCFYSWFAFNLWGFYIRTLFEIAFAIILLLCRFKWECFIKSHRISIFYSGSCLNLCLFFIFSIWFCFLQMLLGTNNSLFASLMALSLIHVNML